MYSFNQIFIIDMFSVFYINIIKHKIFKCKKNYTKKACYNDLKNV